LGSEQRAFEKNLKQARLSAADRLAREKAHRTKVEQDIEDYENEMSKLSKRLKRTKHQIEVQESQYQKKIRRLASNNIELEQDLIRAKKRADARREIARIIKKKFKEADIDADVNLRTGEVVIHFGENYFPTGSSRLTPPMMDILKKAFPAYAAAIFKDEKIARAIESVDIVGFASPTFKGKYIDPEDLSPKARNAVNYNMDLSYKRASAIFREVFDTTKLSYKFQKGLLKKSKVSGIGYLQSQKAKNTGGRSLSRSEYCKKYNCSQSQKVIIKFNFEDSY